MVLSAMKENKGGQGIEQTGQGVGWIEKRLYFSSEGLSFEVIFEQKSE